MATHKLLLLVIAFLQLYTTFVDANSPSLKSREYLDRQLLDGRNQKVVSPGSNIPASKQDLEGRSMTIALEVAKTKAKRASSLAKTRVGQGDGSVKSRDETESVGSEQEAIDRLNEGSQTYFATFDATALSTAWLKLGGQAKAEEDQINQREKQNKLQSHGYVPESSSAYVSLNPSLQATEDEDEAPHEVEKMFQSPLPDWTEDKKREMTVSSLKYLKRTTTFERMHATNSLQHIQKQLPLVMMLLCDCPLDLQLVKTLPYLDSIIHKRRWKSLFHFVYIPATAQQVFQLTETYKLDQQLITVGPCNVGVCPNNSKRVQVKFPVFFASAPTDLTIALHQECCGDKFGLSLHEVTASGFTLVVTRTDPGQNGWGQVLKARWATSLLPYATPGGVPTILLDNLPMGIHSEKYRWQAPFPLWKADEQTVEQVGRSILQFLEFFQMGRLPLIVRSKPVLENSLTVAGAAMEVVGDTFESMVLSRTNDVLLFVYSPFCGGSRALMPLLEQVSQVLAQHVPDRKVSVARFDKTANDFPVTGIKITHFPTILFFPAGNFDSPSYKYFNYADFNGSQHPHNNFKPHSHFTKEMFVKFVYDHSVNKASFSASLVDEIAKYKLELYHDDDQH